ncbi:MAG: L,D-transpeptidase family protein [Pseudomonadota bacterium]
MRWLTILATALFVLSANGWSASANAQESLPGESVSAALEDLLSSEAEAAVEGGAAADVSALRQFYAARDFDPLWTGDAIRQERAVEVLEIIQSAEREGLLPDHYGATSLTEQATSTTSAGKAAFELNLSRAFIRYGQAIHAGQTDPTLVNDEVRVVPPNVAPETLLFAAGNNAFPADVLRSLAPAGGEYQRLRAALAEYRALAAAGGWPQIDEGETLRPGDEDPRVEQVRARLAVTGELAAWRAEGGPLFDSGLFLAVREFQSRHGLEQDGIIGPMTLTALNVTAEQRVNQMVLNMERRRWMGPLEGRRYIFVNLADFQLKLVSNGKTIHTARTVVGAPYHRTPVFTEDMTYLVINPNWHVPSSIARNELLPKAQEDPTYLAANNFAVLDADGTPVPMTRINWNALDASNLPYRFRQGPGDGNALGRVKFMLPNEYNIYLHDTPSKSLFGRSVRAFSHGCVRVQDPFDLAEVILADQGWSRSRIDAANQAGDRLVVTLKDPIPVYISYITAWANKDGTVHFRDDIYGRDATLADAILGVGS